MTHDNIMAFKAPGWATDWCPYCGWDAKCAQCRAWME
jgi:primosomal protein N'